MGHLRDVVAPNVAKTHGIIIAATEPCLGLAQKPPLSGGRVIHRPTTSSLNTASPPASCAVAVIVCPGDDTCDLTAWADLHKIGDERVYFFFHPDADPEAATQAWRDAGRRILSTMIVKQWGPLNQAYGNFLNLWCHADHCPDPACRIGPPA